MDSVDSLENEIMDLRLGAVIWELFLSSYPLMVFEEGNRHIQHYLFSRFCALEVNEFFRVARLILSQNQEGAKYMERMANDIVKDLQRQDYNSQFGDDEGYSLDDILGYADGGSVNNEIEVVVVAKELEKDGGRILKFRYLMAFDNKKDAIQHAKQMWLDEYDNSDIHLVEVLTADDYKQKYMKNKYANGGNVILQVGDMVKIIPNYPSHYTNSKGQIVKIMPDNKTYEVKIKHKRKGSEYVKFDISELVFLGNEPKYADGGGVAERINEKDFENGKSFTLGSTKIILSKKQNPKYYSAKYIDTTDNEVIGVYGSPNYEDVRYDILTQKYSKGGEANFDIYEWDDKMALINLGEIYEYAIKIDKMIDEDTDLEEWVKMKLTRIEQNIADVKHSLAGWEKYKSGGEISKKQLLHIAKYSKDLIEMIQGGSRLMSWQEDKLAVSSQSIDDIYHHLDYKMGNRAEYLDVKDEYAGGGEVGDLVEVELTNGKVIKGKIEKINPLKIRTDNTSTQVIPNPLVKSITKLNEYAGGGGVKIKNMKPSKKYGVGGNLTFSKEDYFLVVQNWVYFTFNYPYNFVKDAFNSKHLEEKFSSSYSRYGSVGVLMSFWANLDNENRRILSLWIKNNYFNGDKTKLMSISDDNYAKIITHWNMFCFNYPYKFIESVFGGTHLLEHFESKFLRAYESAGSNGAVNKFFTELSSNNQELLTDWVYDNYSPNKYAVVVGLKLILKK